MKEIIKKDIVAFMHRIPKLSSEKITPGQIAVFAGQHYAMGELLARGEIIPNISVYRLLEKMAGMSIREIIGIKKLSPFRKYYRK